jgi:hypothetical protein
VTQFVAEHVAPYKKVRAVEIVEEIPKSAVWGDKPAVRVSRTWLLRVDQSGALQYRWA